MCDINCEYKDKCKDYKILCFSCKHNICLKKSYYEPNEPFIQPYITPYWYPDGTFYKITCDNTTTDDTTQKDKMSISYYLLSKNKEEEQ